MGDVISEVLFQCVSCIILTILNELWPVGGSNICIKFLLKIFAVRTRPLSTILVVDSSEEIRSVPNFLCFALELSKVTGDALPTFEKGTTTHTSPDTGTSLVPT